MCQVFAFYNNNNNIYESEMSLICYASNNNINIMYYVLDIYTTNKITRYNNENNYNNNLILGIKHLNNKTYKLILRIRHIYVTTATTTISASNAATVITSVRCKIFLYDNKSQQQQSLIENIPTKQQQQQQQVSVICYTKPM